MIDGGGMDWLKVAAYASLAACGAIACLAWYASDSLGEALDWERIADEGDGHATSLLSDPTHDARIIHSPFEHLPSRREDFHV